jgi:hypothetical protein
MTNDGTQDPVPPPVLADPLAGLVTGSRYEPEPLRVRVTRPAMPDISAVREAMASVLDEDSELNLGSIASAEDFFTDSTSTATAAQPAPAATPVAQVPVSQVPTQAPGASETQPAQAPVRRPPAKVPTRGAVTRVPPTGVPTQRRPGTIGSLPPAITRGEDTRRIRLPAGFSRRGPDVPGNARGSSSAGSVTLIMVLLLVMVVLGFVALASLIDTIASVFD